MIDSNHLWPSLPANPDGSTHSELDSKSSQTGCTRRANHRIMVGEFPEFGLMDSPWPGLRAAT